MIRERDCPICGASICFKYVTPDKNFYILNGKIEHDTNNLCWEDEGWIFQCSDDSTHDLYGHGSHPKIGLEQEKWEDYIKDKIKESHIQELL